MTEKLPPVMLPLEDWVRVRVGGNLPGGNVPGGNFPSTVWAMEFSITSSCLGKGKVFF